MVPIAGGIAIVSFGDAIVTDPKDQPEPVQTSTKTDDMDVCSVIRAGRPSAEDAEVLTDRILQASWELLLQIGFENFSIDKLAKYGRFGKPTIYARFPGKAELLRAVLMKNIKERTRGLFEGVTHHHIDEAIPALCSDGVEFYHSPEGRLMERLIDWLDIETEDGGASMRGWSAEVAIHDISELLERAVQRGEIRMSEIKTASLFLMEGICGHARLAEVQDKFDREPHMQWATRYWAMIKKTFCF